MVEEGAGVGVVVRASSKSLIHTGDPVTDSQLEHFKLKYITVWSKPLPHISPSVTFTGTEHSAIVPRV